MQTKILIIMKTLKTLLSLILLFTLSSCDCFLGFIGPDCDEPIEPESSFFNITIENTEKITEENKIKVRFKVTDDTGIGVANKTDSDFNLFEQAQSENEQLIDPSEAPRLIVPSPESYGYATMIIIDLSGSVIDEIGNIKTASIDYVNNLFNSINSGNLEVGIFFFDGRTELQQVIDFSTSRNEIIDAISGMTRDLQVEIQTALYHAVIQSCDKINLKTNEFQSNPDIKIYASSIVIFSDGNNSNFVNVSNSQMVSKIAANSLDTDFYCISAGNNPNLDVVNQIGFDGLFQIDNYSQLNGGLNEVLNLIIREANSNYELEICTAKRGTNVNYRLEVKDSETIGGTGTYNTDGFNPQNQCSIN